MITLLVEFQITPTLKSDKEPGVILCNTMTTS